MSYYCKFSVTSSRCGGLVCGVIVVFPDQTHTFLWSTFKQTILKHKKSSAYLSISVILSLPDVVA